MKYEVCSTHLPAAIAARYFSLQLGLPTMTCVQLGENPWDEHTSPQAPQQWQSTRYAPVDSWKTIEPLEVLLFLLQ